MTADKIFPVPENYKNSAHVTKEIYEDLCQQAEADSEKFWGKIGKRVDWIKPYSKIKNVTWSKKNVDINWYYDGKLNVSENCIDRHLKDKADDIAIIWEGDNPNDVKKITYKELLKNVCKTANSLKKRINKIIGNISKQNGCKYKIKYMTNGEPFLTKPNKTIYLAKNIIKKITKVNPKFSTTGGTSDARFIRLIAPCLEFGLVNKTMHRIDECVSLSDLKKLTDIYNKFLIEYFK